MYCGKYDNGKKVLRLYVKCELEDWIHMERIQFKNTSGTDITFDLSRDRESEVTDDAICFEWADISVSSKVDELKSLVRSSEIYVKLHGKYPREWKMTTNQRTIFREMLEVYDAL